MLTRNKSGNARARNKLANKVTAPGGSERRITSPRAARPFRTWTPRRPDRPRRRTLLYRRWQDLCQRVKGKATRTPELYRGLELGWSSFAEFREWALASGFSKENSSPDRIDAGRGYTPDNVRFVPPYVNTFSALDDYNHWRARERVAPADNSDVPF